MPKRKGTAAKRAWRSLGTNVKKEYRRRGKAMGKTRAQTVQSFGGATRRSRIGRGTNPNTGATLTAKQLGLKGAHKKAYRSGSTAHKRSVVRGAVAKAGNVGGMKGIGKATRNYGYSFNRAGNKRSR